jgi:outer membrane protein TolC
LRGKGKVYNSSLIVLAQIDKNIAWHQFSRELQDHLVEVANGYWELYLQRAVLLQRERHFARATAILQELETRGDIDTARSQIVRAQSAVAARRSDLARARAAVRNAQVQLRALVNMPELEGPELELVPNEQPNPQFINVSLDDALVTALENRPEIDEAMQQLKSARVQVSVAQHELLPVLDVVTETYVSGLRNGTNVGDAWVDQFSVGEPSYSLGLEMEVPLQNRAARARHRRKRLQLQWIVSRYQDTLATLTAEVEIVVRDIHTAYTEMIGKYHAMKATQAELDYLTARWQLLPGDDRSASFLLEDLLNIQDRLVGHEFELARAQVAYTQALVDLKRATGTLLDAEEVTTSRACECGIPQLYLSKPAQYEEGGYELDSGGPIVDEAILSEPMPEDLPLPEEGRVLEPLQVPE